MVIYNLYNLKSSYKVPNTMLGALKINNPVQINIYRIIMKAHETVL